MKLLEALALVDSTEGAIGVSSAYEEEGTFLYKDSGVLLVGSEGRRDPEVDEEATITLSMLERNDYELVMKPSTTISFTEEQFIAAWDNAVRRSVPTLGLFANSNVGKATLNTLKQLYTVR